MRPQLRLNQGDPSEARSYYCAHFIARARGWFEAEGVEVVFQTTASGGHTVRGGQIPAVLAGAADLTIGGPMVTMKSHEDGEPALVSFCASVAGSPWGLASMGRAAGADLAGLAGARVIDIGQVGTAQLCLAQILAEAGLADQVTLLPGSGDHAADIAAVAAGQADFAYHSLHHLAPDLVAGRLLHWESLAAPTGPVPWSAYIARPEVMAQKAPAFAAFTRAIARAIRALQEDPVADLVASIAADYPDLTPEALALSLTGFRAAQVFARTPLIARADFEHFSAMLVAQGWLRAPAPYEALVTADLALAAGSEGGNHA